MPGSEAIKAMVSIGINAHWLLTGQGPMIVDVETMQAEPTKKELVAEILRLIAQLESDPELDELTEEEHSVVARYRQLEGYQQELLGVSLDSYIRQNNEEEREVG